MSSTSTESPLECFFLGTATSTGLPLTPCLTLTAPYPASFQASLPLPHKHARAPKGSYDPEGSWPSNIPCCSCRSAVDPNVPEGKRNIRGNTSMVLRKKDKRGEYKNVVLDVGKTFRENSARWFPVWGIKTIDAVILTHGHADAYFGLDDLREWCIRQGTTIPVYLNRPTYETVAASFPYLVDKSQASGGGDVPSLKWHIIEDISQFTIHGISVQSIPVHHGIYFRPRPSKSTSGAPDDSPSSKHVRSPHKRAKPETLETEPLICLGFIFDERVVYMSDVSDIPERTWKILDRYRRGQGKSGSSNGYYQANGAPPTPRDTPPNTGSIPSDSLETQQFANLSLESTADRPLILIVDTLFPIRQHTSHFNFAQALETALRLNASITYGLGFVHPTTHFMWQELCLAVRGKNGQRSDHPDSEMAAKLVKRVWSDEQFAGETGLGKKLKAWSGRVEPACDGLGLVVGGLEWKEVEYKGIYF